MQNTTGKTTKLILSALFLALCFVLPNLTGSIPTIGSMLLPMHLPVLLCGFFCGGFWGGAVGFTAPILRSLLIGMPKMYPMAIAMSFELAVYGIVCGVLYHYLPKKNLTSVYISLIVAMVAGRVVFGVVNMTLIVSGGGAYPFSAFIASTLTGSIPGIILQLIVVPALVVAVQKHRSHG